MMKSISIIGAGNMAREYLKVLQDLNHCKVLGIFSRSRNKALEISREFNIGYVASSVSDLYEKTKSDMVIICVNEESTLEVAKEVFNFAWASLFEKPFGINPTQTELISSYANDAKNLNIYIALNRRYYETTTCIQAQLDKISDRRVININDQEDTVSAKSSGRSDLEIKYWHYLNAIHIIDFALIFGRGDVTDVIQSSTDLADKEFVKNAIIHFSSGDKAIYQCLWNRPSPWFVTVSVSTRRFIMQPLESCYETTQEDRSPKKLIESTYDKEYKPGLYNMINLFLDYEKNKSQLVTIKKYNQLSSLISKIYPE